MCHVLTELSNPDAKIMDAGPARPLRICMLVGSYAPDHEGGAERQCRILARALAKRGHEVDVITFRHTRRAPPLMGDDGVRVRRLGLFGPMAMAWGPMIASLLLRTCSPRDPVSLGRVECHVRALAFWLAMPAVWLARLGFLIEIWLYAGRRRASFDILHVHESGWLAGVGVGIGKRWGIPVICKEATTPALGVIGYDTPFRIVLDRARRRADAWIAQTQEIAKELFALGVPVERVCLLPNGVTLPAETADPSHSTGVLYVGNLTQGATWKAFDVLFNAWIRVARTRADVRLTVIGGGDPEPWSRILRCEGVESSVHFTGHLDDPSPMYRSAGIFVLPSRVEGMSNALLEAQSWGLACVVSDIPGNLAVVENGVNGLAVSVGDAEELAQAILRLLSDPDLRLRLGRTAREKIVGNFGVQSVAERLTRIYHAMAIHKNSVSFLKDWIFHNHNP